VGGLTKCPQAREPEGKSQDEEGAQGLGRQQDAVSSRLGHRVGGEEYQKEKEEAHESGMEVS